MSTLSPLLTLPTPPPSPSSQLNHSQLKSKSRRRRRRRRQRWESKEVELWLNQQQVRLILYCVHDFSFLLVRDLTHTHTHMLTHTHSQQAHLPPSSKLPCCVREKSASQEQEMKEQTHIQAAFCHCRYQPKHTLMLAVADVPPLSWSLLELRLLGQLVFVRTLMSHTK